MLYPGLLISIIAIASDTIADTFKVSLSLSAILFYKSIASSIGDTFTALFGDTAIPILFHNIHALFYSSV
jgi:hypothetical protein